MKNQIQKIGWGFGRCNQHCKHCYNNSSLKDTIPVYSLDELKSVADKICPYIKDINFGTGEFLCNSNTLKLTQYIRKKYPRVDMSLTSNGYSVLKIEDDILKSIFNDIDISLDFPDEARNNAFRDHPKAWDWATSALLKLKKLRMQYTIVTCVTGQTTDDDILGMIELSKKYNSNMRINWYRHSSEGRGDEGMKITAKRAWDIIRLLSDKVVFSSLDSIFAGPLNLEGTMPCPAGHLSCRIHQDMSVTAYPFLKGEKWSAGNILDPKTDLEDIYNSIRFTQLRSRNVSFCKGCEFSTTCAGGCVTRAALHNGSISETDDYCPVSAGLLDEIKDIKITMQKLGNLVHDGYLCTTIFHPKENLKFKM